LHKIFELQAIFNFNRSEFQMFCLCRASATRCIASVLIARKQLQNAKKYTLTPQTNLAHCFPRRYLSRVKSKVSGRDGMLNSETERRTPRASQVESLTHKKVVNKSSDKSKDIGEKIPEKAVVKQPHKLVTADELKEFPFLTLGVSRQLTNRLNENLGIKTPVEIQSLAIRPISSYRNLVIQSETGSGKTLAYLLPVIQQAKHRCHTIIAVPTRELAYQIYIEARKLTPKKDLACYVSRPGIETEFQRLKESPPKIIIGTPKQLLSVVRDHEFLFSNVKRFIADEVDKMLPPIPTGMRWLIRKRERHPKPLTVLLAVIEGIAKKPVQYIACSATIDDQIVENLTDLQWGRRMNVIKSEKCHETPVAVPSSIKHNYVFIPDFSIDSKVAVLSKIFVQTGKKPTLVFVHRDHSSNDYVKELVDLNINAVSYYKQVLGGGLQDIKTFLENFRTGNISVVVASEEEVRGLDFKDLQHVFIFQVPRTAEEYLHLAGRVGRLGKEGIVTTVIAELHDIGLTRLLNIYKRLGITGKEIEA